MDWDQKIIQDCLEEIEKPKKESENDDYDDEMNNYNYVTIKI